MQPCPSVSFPQRQKIPRFSAVAAWLSSPRPFCRPSVRHYPSVPFPQRQQIPRFGAVAESHSAWPLATGSLIIHLILLPPSEGVQYSRVFVSPSEGVWSRHIFESALCQCFSCHRGIPTFQRCADFPCFRLTFRRCAESSLLRERPVSVFLLRPCISHLPKVCKIPPFSSHLPKVRGVATSSRAPCIRVSPVTVHFPPSEGVQYSRVFVSPSEGVRRRNSFESALCQCFSCHRGIPTFQRCADFPCFRLTFRRCAESSLLRERPVSVFLLRPCISNLPKVRSFPAFSSHLPKVCSFKMKRPDALCRKTSIAITRILVFLPLLNRK